MGIGEHDCCNEDLVTEVFTITVSTFIYQAIKHCEFQQRFTPSRFTYTIFRDNNVGHYDNPSCSFYFTVPHRVWSDTEFGKAYRYI